MIKPTNKTETEQLKPAQEFNGLEQLSEPQNSKHEIKQAQEFSDEQLDETEFNQLFDKVERNVNNKKRSRSKLARWAVISLFALAAAELGLSLAEAWQQSPFLFGLYSAAIGLVGAWAGRGIYREFKKLSKLKAIKSQQDNAERVGQSMQTGEAGKFISAIKLPPEFEIVQADFEKLKHPHLNDAELLKLYDETVLAGVDAKAKKIVHKYAAESALLLAVSPFASLDMLLVLLRNQKMLSELTRCYGIELGYISRMKLIRGIFTNILFAGASELLTDLGGQLFSLELTGKLSVKLGQGLAGGLLTARLGYQAMALCRPVQFKKHNKPRLSKIHKSLLFELKSFSEGLRE